MFAAAFLDAGLVSRDELEAVPGMLGWTDVQIEVRAVERASIRCTHLHVTAGGQAWKDSLKAVGAGQAAGAGQAGAQAAALSAFQVVAPAGSHSGHSHPHAHHHPHAQDHAHSHRHGSGEGWHTHYIDLDRLLAQSKLPPNVKNRARAIFRELAAAESAAHGIALDQVAFHEVGTFDSICDVVMAALCLDRAGASEFVCTPVPVGRGFIRIDHGIHAVPPPATARLLKGMLIAPVPGAIQRENVELTTPTGAAILRHIAPRFAHEWPAGEVCESGMGAGTMEFENFPNVVRVALIKDSRYQSAESAGRGAETSSLERYVREDIVELRFTVDDQTGEQTGRLAQKLLSAGALDVQVIQSISKKGRPGCIFEILSAQGSEGKLADLILRESSSFGVRITPQTRWKLVSRFEERSAPEGVVRVRIGEDAQGRRVKEKPEFDDLE